MKQDDDPWQLDRLGAAEAPELWGAVAAAKRQLPNAQDLTALAANLSALGLPLPNQEGVAPALRATPGFRMRWPAIGAAAIGLAVLSVKLAGPPVADSKSAPARAPDHPTERGAPGVDTTGAPGAGAGVARANQGAFEPTASTPTLPSANLRVDAPSAPLPASGPAPQAATQSSPTPTPQRSAPDPAMPSNRSLAGARPSQSSSTVAQGASLEAGTKGRPSEIELLRDARLALRSSPSLALGLTEQHSALYPRGSMAQERELIAISALVQLGRHAAVLSRAQRFERDFPNSPYRKQIAQMAE